MSTCNGRLQEKPGRGSISTPPEERPLRLRLSPLSRRTRQRWQQKFQRRLRRELRSHDARCCAVHRQRGSTLLGQAETRHRTRRPRPASARGPAPVFVATYGRGRRRRDAHFILSRSRAPAAHTCVHGPPITTGPRSASPAAGNKIEARRVGGGAPPPAAASCRFRPRRGPVHVLYSCRPCGAAPGRSRLRYLLRLTAASLHSTRILYARVLLIIRSFSPSTGRASRQAAVPQKRKKKTNRKW